MKSLVYKLLAFIFVTAIITSCASVTDANLDQQTKTNTVMSTQPENPDFGAGGPCLVLDNPDTPEDEAGPCDSEEEEE